MRSRGRNPQFQAFHVQLCTMLTRARSRNRTERNLWRRAYVFYRSHELLGRMIGYCVNTDTRLYIA
jgi:hypothetical protein